jgi:CheY-like chemotaxis protein
VMEAEEEDGPESDLAPPRGNERILFVDDEEILVRMGKEMLESLGYRVTGVADSRKALELFLSAPDAFDLVISDITMPGMTGDALLEAIRKKRPYLPVVICTGYSERVSETEAKRIGARAFLLKPFSVHTIGGVIRSILDCGEKT